MRRVPRSTRCAAATAALCLAVAGCGGGGGHGGHSHRTGTTPTTPAQPTSFKAGYQQSWAEMRAVGADVAAVVRQARHHHLSNQAIASKFAVFEARLEPAVIEFQSLTPPASVAGVFRAMAPIAGAMSGALRSFSADANTNRVRRGALDIVHYFNYAAELDRGAIVIYKKLGIS